MPNDARPLIQVIDEIVARPGEGKALLDDYLARYAPGARARISSRFWLSIVMSYST